MDIPDIITADESNFQFQVLDYSQHQTVVVEFWAKWSQNCQQTSQQLEKLVREHAGQFRLARVDVDRNPHLTQSYQVHTVPTLKVFENGSVSARLEGPKTGLQLAEFIDKIAPGPERLLLEKAASQLAKGVYRTAEDTCLEILEEDPDNPPAKLLLARSLIWQGEHLEALTLLHSFPPSREYPSAEKLLPLTEALLTVGESQEVAKPLDAVYNRALRLIESGSIPAGLDGLLEIIRQDKGYRGGAPQALILGIFELLGEKHPLVGEYRQLLASALF